MSDQTVMDIILWTMVFFPLWSIPIKRWLKRRRVSRNGRSREVWERGEMWDQDEPMDAIFEEETEELEDDL